MALLEAQKLSSESLDDIAFANAALEAELKSVMEEKGKKLNQLESNAQSRQIKEKLRGNIAAKEEEYENYRELDSLIGSHDGKNFSKFAQGVTFETLIGHANRQLRSMSDRYLLAANIDQSLDLHILDNYQGGERRSVKNLSGGESFIVSLALALGLSRMVSKKTRVDSFFLDEGFGTLDENSLDMALATLENLRGEGKMIGIISHIPAVKERIAVNVEIIGTSGGKSIISGPGCSGAS